MLLLQRALLRPPGLNLRLVVLEAVEVAEAVDRLALHAAAVALLQPALRPQQQRAVVEVGAVALRTPSNSSARFSIPARRWRGLTAFTKS